MSPSITPKHPITHPLMPINAPTPKIPKQPDNLPPLKPKTKSIQFARVNKESTNNFHMYIFTDLIRTS